MSIDRPLSTLEDFEATLGAPVREVSWNEFAAEVFGNNKAKGFWPEDVWDRNVGEALCLVHSELTEADEASIDDLPDDKLLQYPGVAVELADAAIRVLDMGYAWGADFSDSKVLPYFATAGVYTSLEQDIAYLRRIIDRALEGNRKGKKVGPVLEELFGGILATLYKWGYDSTVIFDKVEFNKSRPFKHGKTY